MERGEGAYVFDTHGNRYVDGLSSLFCAQIGYSYGEEMGAVAAQQLQQLAFSTIWGTAHPPALELADSSPGLHPRASIACSSPPAAQSPSRPPGSSPASTTSPTASRSG